MNIPRRLLVASGLGASVFGANLAATRRWRNNPNPLDGEVPRFPEGEAIVVPTDDGAELNIVRSGEGPAVVFVHGITSNADDWGPVARRLVEKGYRVIGLNQRGHGGSSVGSEGFGGPRQGRDVQQVLAALDLDDIVLVGHSMGGMVAMSYAVDHPVDLRSRVRGLCLISTLADVTDAEGRAGLAIIAGRPATDWGGQSDLVDGIRRRAARFVFGRKPNWDLMGHAVQTALRCPDDTRISAARGLADHDVSHRLDRIGVPTTVICGTADLITRYSKNTTIADAIAGARMVTVPGAGHMLLWEAPDLLTDEIASLVPVG